jgi:hypothetical protein
MDRLYKILDHETAATHAPDDLLPTMQKLDRSWFS